MLKKKKKKKKKKKRYKNDHQIVALTNLINAYQRVDIDEFESILKSKKKFLKNKNNRI